MVISAAVLVLDEMRDNVIHERLALMEMRHRHAPECVPEAAARCDDIVIIIKHRCGVVEIFIPADALLLEQLIHGIIHIPVARPYL